MDDNLLFKAQQQQRQDATTRPVETPVAVQTPAPPPAVTTETIKQDLEQIKAQAQAQPQTPQVETPAPAPAETKPTKPQIPEDYQKGAVIKRILMIILTVILIAVIIFVVMFFLHKSGSKKVNLIWWGLWEDPAVVKPIISDFERANPSVTVEYSKQDPKQYRQRLTARVQNGTGPDIFYFHNTWYPMISDVVLPLSSDVISPDSFKKTFYPVMQKDLVHNGAIYGIPMGADTISLFVNTELLSAAGVSVPVNWDDFVKAAKSLTVKDENGKIQTAGAALGTFDNITHAPDIISILFAQQGVDLNKFSSFASDESDVLDFYTSFAKGDNNTWDNSLDPSITLFSQGKLAMYFGYSWDIFTIQRLSKDLKFETHPVPSLFDRGMTVASYWSSGVSAKSTHQKEAFLFMQYLAKKETAQKLYTEEAKTRAFGEPYARIDLANSLKENNLIYPFVSQLSKATSSFFASDTDDGDGGLNSASNVYLENAINSMIKDNSSATSAVDTLNKGVAQVFTKYGIQ